MRTLNIRWHMPWPALLLVIAAVACGTAGAGSEGLERISNDGAAYSIEDLRSAGLKVNKEYDVSELPGARSAWRGVLNSREYEARFYATHEDVLELGVPMADEVTGPDALVNKGEATWQEGYRDRKFCTEYPNTQCGAKYQQYVIRGNMLLMCEGLDSEQSLEACQVLLERISAEAG